MTNFTLFQTERVCRRQFKIWWRWWKLLHKGGKHFEKRRNCLSGAISLFPTVFSKDFNCGHVITRACLGKGYHLCLISCQSSESTVINFKESVSQNVSYLLTVSQTSPGFYVSAVQVFWKQAISPFLTMFSTLYGTYLSTLYGTYFSTLWHLFIVLNAL